MKPLLAPLALAATLLLVSMAQAAPVPPNADWTEAYIGSDSGEPVLHADILKPKGTPPTTKLPAIVSVGPYFNHSGSTVDGYDPTTPYGPNDRWKDLIEQGHIFERGYALVLVDLRGFGASEGCNDFGGPGEQADSQRAVKWTASQEWSTGKVGMWGKSYDGWTQVMALNKPSAGLAAAIIQSPIIDGYRTLYQDGVHYDSGWYATPGIYQGGDAQPPTIFDSPEYFQHSALGTNPACYGANIAMQDGLQDHDDAAGFWKARDLPTARGSEVPVMWSHGFMDANTKPDNFMDVWSTLKGPKRAWFGQYEHVRGNEAERTGRLGFFDEAFRFLDRYVKGDKSVDPFVDPVVEVAEGNGRWRGEAAWPPADAVVRRMALKAGTYTDDNSNTAEGSSAGNGIWSISAPLPYDVHLAGVPKITVQLSTSSARANMVGLLYDFDPTGKATLIQRGAGIVTSAMTEKTIELYPDDWTIEKGHHIGVLVAGSDEDWYTPPHSQLPVEITGGTISLPMLTYIRDGYLEGKPTPYMETRRPITVDSSTISSAVSALELPGELTPRPAGSGQGATPAPPAAAKPANKLRITRRLFKRHRLRVIVTGGGASKVRLVIKRGRRIVFRRTLASRRGRAAVLVNLKRKGTYRVSAQVLGGVRLTGSRVIRLR